MHILQCPAVFGLWQFLPEKAKIIFLTKSIFDLLKTKNYNAKGNILKIKQTIEIWLYFSFIFHIKLKEIFIFS